MRVCIDTCSVEDFDTVVRHLYDRGIDVSDRDKMMGEIRADLSKEQITELRELNLKNEISIGRLPLLPEPRYALNS